jgi:hypothetical protein
MKKLALLLLTIAVYVGSMLLIGNVHASTPVSGTITSDITWTKAGSPYELTGTVVVNSGVTLSIEPGSPLTLGGSPFAEMISQFDIIGLANLVLIALGIMWVIIILASVERKFAQKDNKKQ